MDLRRYAKMPAVGAVMTPFPHHVHADDSVETVEELMARHEIRHVPVERDGRVVGIITERDLHRLVNPALPRVDKRHIRARDVLVPDPFVVEMHTPLDEVVSEMAERHIGSAIVVRNGRLAGIFSVTDACQLLAGILSARFPGSGGDAA